MTFKSFRPTHGRVQNASKLINGTRSNATIRDLEEEEGELEEKEGIVTSIKQDLINGAGWTVKSEDQTYICSCATSMYELPETKERGGYLYPTEKVKVRFQINPVLKINTITEILSLGDETETLDISKWKHGDKSTTVIAKPKSAISISNGFIDINYNNNNKVTADDDAITTTGKKTQINTKETNINSDVVKINGVSVFDLITGESRAVSNEYASYHIKTINDVNLFLDRSNNMTQIDISTSNPISGHGVIGEIKDQKAIPIREQSQQLITDGHCTDIITIDTDGIIRIKTFENECTEERSIMSTNNWITPQVESRNYIKVIVPKTCDYCHEGTNTKSEFINYCPKCKNFNTLIDTSISIKCTCGAEYCQNCGTNLSDSSQKLKKYQDTYVIGYGTTCKHCNTQLQAGTNKQYVNYCPDCEEWGWLTQTTMEQDGNTINILKCNYCNAKFCCTCGINQEKHGLTLTNSPVQYSKYKNALRKLKYIKDGV